MNGNWAAMNWRAVDLPAAAVILAVVFFLAALRKQRADTTRKYSELLSILRSQREESAIEIGRLARDVQVLEQSRLGTEEACTSGLPRSRRAQAIQLLRAGMSPESAASSLGMATAEMRLISRVSRLLEPR